MYIRFYLSLVTLCLYLEAQAQDNPTVVGVFNDNPPRLQQPMELKCYEDGDKIKISDVNYRISGCTSSDFRSQDPITEENRKWIDSCTGKRTCAIPADRLQKPLVPRKATSCLVSSMLEVVVIYSCVPQEKIESMCNSFVTQSSSGYLSTPRYPMALKPGEPVGPCRCSLEATLNSRIVLTLLEANLASNSTEEDMSQCQIDTSRQYLDVSYHHGMKTEFYLCSHKYNQDVEVSTTYELLFENPISREAGAVWMQYTAEKQDAVVKVTCIEPVVTTLAPIFYTSFYTYGNNGRNDISSQSTERRKYRLILGIVAGCLFLTILVAIIVLSIKYKRWRHTKYLPVKQREKIQHYMMDKYSKRKPPGTLSRHHTHDSGIPKLTVQPTVTDTSSYQETHFDMVDDTTSYGKPTAHIPPTLSHSNSVNELTEDTNPKSKLTNGGPKYSTFKSSYLKKPVADSDSDDSVSSQRSKGSRPSPRSDQSESTETGSSSSVSVTRPKVPSKRTLQSNSVPKFEDIWVRVNSQEPQYSVARGKSMGESVYASSDETVGLLQRPAVSFSSCGETLLNPKDTSLIPIMQRSEDSRILSDEEEMDIKDANPVLASVSPYRTIAKPALKSSHNPRTMTPRRDSGVKFSANPDIIQPVEIYSRPQSERSHYAEVHKARRQGEPPSAAQKPQRHPQVTMPISAFNHQSKLMVDISTPKKSKSLPRHTRRLNSAPLIEVTDLSKSLSHLSKRQKRKCASDNDTLSPTSSQSSAAMREAILASRYPPRILVSDNGYPPTSISSDNLYARVRPRGRQEHSAEQNHRSRSINYREPHGS